MGSGRAVSVGDIYWVALPAADGREQRGRPAVVVQADDYGGDLPVVLVIPLTTARAAIRFAGTTLIHPTAENGLRQGSVALVFQLRAIDRQPARCSIITIVPSIFTGSLALNMDTPDKRSNGSKRP
jgi:mRNA-degrading endonuclease toxin of MazEF toxin-antitoxin module